MMPRNDLTPPKRNVNLWYPGALFGDEEESVSSPTTCPFFLLYRTCVPLLISQPPVVTEQKLLVVCKTTQVELSYISCMNLAKMEHIKHYQPDQTFSSKIFQDSHISCNILQDQIFCPR